jgi:FkbM family methyltransferase
MIDLSVVRPDTFVGRVIRFPLRLLPSGMTVPILQGPLRGKKWISGSQRHAFWLGGYERHLQGHIARALRKGSTFYDIGANVGFYSLLASFLIDPGTVFAFEPLPRNVGYLQRHLVLNGVRNVKVLEMAISDEIGTAKFQTEQTGAMGQLNAAGDLCVKMSTLDALLQSGEISPPDYIKMDIEGAEFGALVGAKRCFEEYKPELFLATHGEQVHKNCIQLLRAWNYEVKLVEMQSTDRGELVATPQSSNSG